MSLTRDQVLGAEDRKTVEVPTPEWGGSVFVRTLSGAERDELEAAIGVAVREGKTNTNARARFCSVFTCDDGGAPLFTLADIDVLTKKSALVLTRILDAGMDLNAMREKDVKALEKN